MSKGVTIAGAEYPIVQVMDFDLDEEQFLYDEAGLTLDDFIIDEEDPDAARELASKARNPAFRRAMLFAAYRRGNPQLAKPKIIEVISKERAVEKFVEFIDAMIEEEDTAGPPAVTEETNTSGSSGESNVSEASTSSEGSGNGSGSLDNHLETTMTGRSGSSAISAPAI